MPAASPAPTTEGACAIPPQLDLPQITQALDPMTTASCSRLMHSQRYGDVTPICEHDAGMCHLCGEPAPLYIYGKMWLYGGQAASVDHERSPEQPSLGPPELQQLPGDSRG